jgi:hypothetical protein
MPDFIEHRAEKRISHKAKSLKIKSASGAPQLANKEFEGSTVNISASGLQIILDHEIPLNSSIDVWVTLDGDTRQHFLSGEIRWCSEAKPNEFHIGILLKNRSDMETDYTHWRGTFKK